MGNETHDQKWEMYVALEVAHRNANQPHAAVNVWLSGAVSSGERSWLLIKQEELQMCMDYK